MQKIQHLLANLPESALITSHLLKDRGISRQLAQSYVDSGWIERLYPGVYKRTSSPLSFYGAVYALQEQIQLPVHICGESALLLHGIFHNITMNDEIKVMHLEGPPKTAIPRWFKLLFLDKFRYRSSGAIPIELGIEAKMIPDGYSINVSRPERAILEVLTRIRNDHDFEEAANLVDSFKIWEIDLLITLLRACKSNKAKRMLLFFGDYFNLEPIKSIANEVEIGKGKIQIVSNGKYQSKFQITIPPNYVQEENPF